MSMLYLSSVVVVFFTFEYLATKGLHCSGTGWNLFLSSVPLFLCETSELLCAFRKLSPEPPLTYFSTQMFPPQIEVRVQNVGSLLIPTLSATEKTEVIMQG